MRASHAVVAAAEYQCGHDFDPATAALRWFARCAARRALAGGLDRHVDCASTAQCPARTAAILTTTLGG